MNSLNLWKILHWNRISAYISSCERYRLMAPSYSWVSWKTFLAKRNFVSRNVATPFYPMKGSFVFFWCPPRGRRRRGVPRHCGEAIRAGRGAGQGDCGRPGTFRAFERYVTRPEISTILSTMTGTENGVCLMERKALLQIPEVRARSLRKRDASTVFGVVSLLTERS